MTDTATTLLRLNCDVRNVSFVWGKHQSCITNEIMIRSNDDVITLSVTSQINLTGEDAGSPGLGITLLFNT
jgi:hypothetical protein